MTNPNEMQPGPELDAAIAVEVMEWSYETFPKGSCPHIKHWYATKPCPRSPQDDAWRGRLPPFSTDWAAAGEVLDKLRADGVYLGLWSTPDGWDVESFEDGTNWVDGVSTGPLAICQAALAAVRARKATP